MPFRPTLLPLLLGLALPAQALDPARAVTQYVHESWRTTEGLPQNTALAVARTRDGYLWVGTQEGLARFDGVRFVVFDTANTPLLRHNWITALHEDRQGVLWVGVRGGGLLRHQDGVFTAVPGLSDERVRALLEDRAGNLWVGTSGGGLNRLHDGRVDAITTREGLPNDQVVALHEDRAGTLWVGTYGGGLAAYRDGRFTVLPGVPDPKISSIAEDAGGLWVGTFGGGVARVEGGRVTRVLREKDGLRADQVWTIRPDRDGNVWIGSDGGLDRWRDGRLTGLGAKDGLTNDVVVALHEDAEGGLWAGTFGGLDRLRDGRFVVFGEKEGLSGRVQTVFQGRGEDVWVGTDGGGLHRWAQGAWSRVPGLSDAHVWALAEDRAGHLWVGTGGGGVNVLRDGRVDVIDSRHGLSDDVVTAIAEDLAGDVWVGTDGAGLNRIQGDSITPLTTRDGLTDDHVTSILASRGGDLWIGTVGGGLNRFRDGRLTVLRKGDGLADDHVSALREDEDGTLWISTSGGGLSRLRDGRLTSVSTRQGLHDDRVFAAIDDGAGRVWMSSNRGVSRVSAAELEAALDGRGRARATVFGVADGLRNAECNGDTQPAAWRTRDGRLWFATVEGVAVVDPAREPPESAPPPPVLEQVVVDGTARDARGPLTLEPGLEKLDLRYTALSLTTPRRLRYQVRLQGFDRAWVDAGSEHVAHYTRLPPGRYTFEVRAAIGEGPWSAVTRLPVTQRPFVHQTLWFRALAALTALAAAFGLHRLRLQRLQRRARELEVVVADQTRDLRTANNELRQAQEQLVRLSADNPDKIENVAAWSARMAADVASAIRATRVDVWRVEGEEMVALVPTSSRAPSRRDVESAGEPGSSPGTALIPVTGMTHELRGALVVHGPVSWGENERRLVSGLASHLGSALDLQHLRAQLTQSSARQAEVRRRMQEQGEATVKLCGACWRCYGDDSTTCAADGLPLDASRLLPYRVAHRYRLTRLLGEGGMGSVFEAADERLGRDVALKVIRAERLAEPGARFRLEREAQALARIEHPSVIGLYDSGELGDGSAYLVMELLHGRDLANVLLRYGPGTPAQVAHVARQAGAALAVAHAVGIVHRDVKPANIVLAPGREGGLLVKVLDFGLAKSLQDDARLTRTGALMGTPAYMSPEQVEGGTVDGRTDVYALATVLYEALTGRKVVAAQDVGRVFVDILYASPPLASSVVRGLPYAVDTAFEDGLEKDPSRRDADIRAWTEKLAAALEAVPPQDGVGWPIDELSAPRTIGAVTLDGLAAEPTTEA